MPPPARCSSHAYVVGVDLVERGKRLQLFLTLRTDEGELGPMWVDVPSPLTARCKFVRALTLALGHAPKAGVTLDAAMLAKVFLDRRFRVAVGWRKTITPGGGTANDKLASTGPKDDADFLRVHDLLELLGPHDG